MSRFGLPGGRNYSKALSLYEEASARMDVEGMTDLAWMHQRGYGTVANATRALELYWSAVELAPDSSHAAAPFLAYWWLRLVMALHVGGGAWSVDEGTQQDLVNILVLAACLMAVLWLRKARTSPRPVRRT